MDFLCEKYLFLLHYGSKLILGDFSLLVVDFGTKICRCWWCCYMKTEKAIELILMPKVFYTFKE